MMESFSGKKDRVVIACVTFEVPGIVDPVLFYEATRVHLIHYVRDPADNKYGVYQEFYDEICRRLEGVEIVEHVAKVYDYQTMLKEVIGIISEEKTKCGNFVDIYVNISSGTSEFAAASMLACMQNKDVIAFTVRTKEYSMTPDDIKRVCFREGRAVGLRCTVYDPLMIPTFEPFVPDVGLISCLQIIDDLNKTKKNVMFIDIIDRMKQDNVWDYSPDSKKTKTDDAQKERMYLKRNYIDTMVSKGWIVEDPIKNNRYTLTMAGEAVLYVYRTE